MSGPRTWLLSLLALVTLGTGFDAYTAPLNAAPDLELSAVDVLSDSTDQADAAPAPSFTLEDSELVELDEEYRSTLYVSALHAPGVPLFSSVGGCFTPPAAAPHSEPRYVRRARDPPHLS